MLQLVECEVIVQMLFNEKKDFSSQVLVLEHYHLGESRQGMLLEHVFRVGRHW